MSYFGEKVDIAIRSFKLESDVKKKNDIFVSTIKPAFDKLAKYHYYRIPVTRDEDVLHDCITYLYEKIDQFDHERYARGFPYFNMITKNFFNQRLKNEKKKNVIDYDVENLEEFSDYSYEIKEDDPLDAENFFVSLREQLPVWGKRFNKDQEKKVIEALIEIFDKIDENNTYNKKIIFTLLKEHTGLNIKQLTSNINKVKKKYYRLKRRLNE